MGLISKILCRKPKKKVKADIKYLKRVHVILKGAIENIKKLAEELNESQRLLTDLDGKQKGVKSLRTKAMSKEKLLVQELKKLDDAVDMYFKIDEFRPDYTDQEKRYLGELQKYWHSICLDELPPEQWSIITRLVVSQNLQHARYLTG